MVGASNIAGLLVDSKTSILPVGGVRPHERAGIVRDHLAAREWWLAADHLRVAYDSREWWLAGYSSWRAWVEGAVLISPSYASQLVSVSRAGRATPGSWRVAYRAVKQPRRRAA